MKNTFLLMAVNLISCMAICQTSKTYHTNEYNLLSGGFPSTIKHSYTFTLKYDTTIKDVIKIIKVDNETGITTTYMVDDYIQAGTGEQKFTIHATNDPHIYWTFDYFCCYENDNSFSIGLSRSDERTGLPIEETFTYEQNKKGIKTKPVNTEVKLRIEKAHQDSIDRRLIPKYTKPFICAPHHFEGDGVDSINVWGDTVRYRYSPYTYYFITYNSHKANPSERVQRTECVNKGEARNYYNESERMITQGNSYRIDSIKVDSTKQRPGTIIIPKPK